MRPMLRMLRGRWLWGILGTAAAAYLLRRRRLPVGNGAGAERTLERAMYDWRRNALDAVYRSGRALAGATVRAMRKR